MKLNEERIKRRYGDLITDVRDVTAGEQASALFPILSRLLFRYLNNDPATAITERDVKHFRRLHAIIASVGKNFLSCPQEIHRSIDLPKEPVIFIANHAFKDDILATVLAAQRHSYVMLASLPAIHNSFDGFSAWLNGLLLTNRKIKESRAASIEKALRILRFGADFIVFPEGVWNKSPNSLMLNLWSGAYRIALESGASIVPIVHYVRDCEKKGNGNTIHTVVCDPVRIQNMEQNEALAYLRDLMATEFYLLMEQYGQSTYAEALEGEKSSADAWEKKLIERVKTAGRYDIEIETTAHYRPRNIVPPEQIFEPIAAINPTADNILHQQFAQELVKTRERENYQGRF